MRRTPSVAAKSAGATMAFRAMFDEVDEGTAILKCADDVPRGGKSLGGDLAAADEQLITRPTTW